MRSMEHENKWNEMKWNQPPIVSIRTSAQLEYSPCLTSLFSHKTSKLLNSHCFTFPLTYVSSASSLYIYLELVFRSWISEFGMKTSLCLITNMTNEKIYWAGRVKIWNWEYNCLQESRLFYYLWMMWYGCYRMIFVLKCAGPWTHPL